MSKEEIIKKYEPYPDKAHVNVISIMMDEYAKQESRREAIEFNEWCIRNNYVYIPYEEMIWNHKDRPGYDISTEQLYDIYILHKKNKEQ